MAKIYEAVSMRNYLTKTGGGKELVSPFRSQEFCKCTGCIVLEETYGKKGHKLWSEIPKTFGNKAPTKLQRYFRGSINLYQVCCDLYCPFLSVLAIELYDITLLCSFLGCFFK